MTPRSLLGLGVVTVAVAAAAAVAVANRYTATPVAQTERPALEGLEDRLNSVARLTVTTADDSFTIRRDGAAWTMAEKQDHPVDAERARTVLIQLSQLRLAETKTRMPERYPRIMVEDVTAENANSTRLTVVDGSGGVLADLIVGKSKTNLAGSGGGVYVRKPDDAQAWLARGAVDLRKRPVDWLVKDIVDIDEDRVRRVATVPADGEPVVVVRQTAEDTTFTLEGVPEGKTAKSGELGGFGAALADLQFFDVLPAGEKPLAEDAVTRAEVETFDGLVVRVSLEESEDHIYARFEAESVAGGDNAAAVEAEAGAINARVAGWVYQVPEYKLRPLLKTRAELIEE